MLIAITAVIVSVLIGITIGVIGWFSRAAWTMW
jgi:hypothetical protein